MRLKTDFLNFFYITISIIFSLIFFISLRSIQLELTSISKTIAGLLTQPLSHVVIQLRELKSSQSAKRKQLESLEVREKSVLKKITSGGSGEEEEEIEGGSHDMSFGLPFSMEGGKMTEEQRLIQTGQLTPFGGQVTAGSAESASTVVNGSLGDNDNTTSSDTLGVAVSKTTPTIQLSNDSFDGLFSNSVFTKPVKKMAAQKNKSPDIKVEQEASVSHDNTYALSAHSNNLECSLENGELYNEEWKPDEAELAMFESEMLTSSDSEYLTDDEMGSPKKKKRKKLRELSSDEEEEGESHVTSKRRSRKRKVKQHHYQDDGDDELYRLRIW